MSKTCDDCRFMACVGYHYYRCTKKDMRVKNTDQACEYYEDKE